MLHWPDTMFTYIPEDKLLLPNDAFGQHIGSVERFTDEVEPAVLWEEARNYFANILTPFSGADHQEGGGGRRSWACRSTPLPPATASSGARTRCRSWSSTSSGPAATTSRPRVLLVYETMWGSTVELARAVAEGLVQAGVPGPDAAGARDRPHHRHGRAAGGQGHPAGVALPQPAAVAERVAPSLRT